MNNSEKTNSPPIKALIVFRESHNTDNLFAPILCDAIRMEGIDVQYSIEDFWESDTTYNIIHFQCPEEVVGWDCDNPDIVHRLEERIRLLRSRGTHFIYTRHNVCPCYANEVISRAYDIIESQSDVIVHMGHFSQNEFLAKHHNSRNIIIPHHIYQFTYQEGISVERARQYLRLPQDAFIIAIFDKFRDKKEKRMMIKVFNAWNEPHKLLLVPYLHAYSQRKKYGRNLWKRLCSRIGYYVLIPLFNHILKLRGGAYDDPIDNCDLPYYIAAADIVLIPQKEKLNSRNIPLAFLYRKVVIGPKMGNISELLEATGNPVFLPDNPTDIQRALCDARILSSWEHGDANYTYALENMCVDKVSKQYAELYRNLVDEVVM